MIKLNKKERIKELVKQLNNYSYEYYTLDDPTISDKEYDMLYDELILLEKETNYILKNSPTQRIGDVVLKEFKKVTHKNKLWSLDKCKTKEEVKIWFNNNKKYCKTHNLPTPQYIITKKFDGLTVKTDYNDNLYTLGSSRGDGVIGEDLTEQCKTIINLPMEINTPLNFSFRGEGLMTKKAFEEYNKKADIPLKTLRNASAGALRNLDVNETAKRKLIIEFYEINDYDSGKIKFVTYENQLEFMKTIGLPVAKYYKCTTLDEIYNALDEIEKRRPNLPFDIDGAVIAINDLDTRDKMGYTIKFPRWAMAYKYKAEETTTTIKDVMWQVGRTRRITPVALLQPVELNGATITRCTLNNIDDISKKGLKLNSNVFIRRSNDVIPEIMGVSTITGKEKEIEIPKICPNCGSLTEIITNSKSKKHTLMCTNPKCSLMQELDHYASRDAMNIVGLSKETIRKFVELGYLNCIEDIYNLNEYRNEITKLKGFGTKSFDKLINNIEKSKNTTLDRFIYALGIPNVGKSTAKDMVEFVNEYPPFNDNQTNTDVIPLIHSNLWKNMNDCGEITANNIFNYFKNEDNIRQYNNLKNILNIDDGSIKEIKTDIKDNILKDKHVYPTGKFKLTKSELKIKLNELGAIVESGYKKSLDYLICGGDTSKSGKVDKAKKDGIKLMTEEELIYILNGFN